MFNGDVVDAIKFALINRSPTGVLFGPFVGELGFEFSRWCGWVRQLSMDKDIKHKIFISTRRSRIGLYKDLTLVNPNVKIIPFDLETDYTQETRPNCYYLDNALTNTKITSIADKITNKLFKEYSDIKVKIDASDKHCQFYYTYNPLNLDYNFVISPEIRNQLKNITTGKRVIVISPRHRLDITNRNWQIEKWDQLYEYFSSLQNVIIFLAGTRGSSYIPTKKYNNIKILDDITPPENSMEITIEVIRSACVTIGQQSAIPILSNLLKTPLITWGHTPNRLMKEDNIFRNKVEYIMSHDSKYYSDVTPDIIINKLKKYLTK